MADVRPLASLSLTHVHYDPLDPISYICAWLALVPQGLCIVYVTLIWSTREVEILLMFTGQMACEALNFGLKRLLKEERPKIMHGKGHAPKPPTSSHTPLSLISRVLLSCLALASAGVVAWSRTYLSYHTTKQILVGFLAGILTAIVWFLLIMVIRQNGILDWALKQYPARLFRMRDMVVEEDLCQAGWEKWELKKLSESENLRRKKNF